MDNTLELFKDKVASPKYNQMLDVGEKQLESLRKELIAKQAEENAPPASVPVSKPTTKAATKRLDLPEEGPDFVAAGAMAAVASMTMLRKGKDDTLETEPEYESVPSLAFANAGYTNTTDMPETRVYYKGPEKFEVQLPSKEERKKIANDAMEQYLNKDDGGDDWLRTMRDIMDEQRPEDETIIVLVLCKCEGIDTSKVKDVSLLKQQVVSHTEVLRCDGTRL